MSEEQDADLGIVAIVVIIFAIAIVLMNRSTTSELRDLQRRVGQLEEQVGR